MSKQNSLLKILGAALVSVSMVVIALGVLYLVGRQNNNQTVGNAVAPSKQSYDIIGSSSASTTINTTYASSTATIVAKDFSQLHLDVNFRPATPTVYAQILIEASNDEGTTFFPYAIANASTSSVSLVVKDSAGNIGVPFELPGDHTTVSSTVYKAGFNITDLAADQIRISAKTSSATGTMYLRATLQSN